MKKDNNVKQTLCFKCWTRKSYAAFSSLGKQIKIGVVALSCSLIGICGKTITVQAQPNIGQEQAPAMEQNVEEVTVVGRMAIPLSEESGITASLDRKQIAALPVQSVQQLLEHFTNIDVRQRGGNDVQADINIRGGSPEQVLILLNGISISDARTGHANFNVPIDLASVDRIELIQMPNAMAGAINIITGISPQTRAEAQISIGDHDYSKQGFYANVVRNKLSLVVSASTQKSDGYMFNTDFDMLNTMAQARYRFSGRASINAQFGYQQKAFGANRFYYAADSGEYERGRTFVSSVSWLQSWSNFALQTNLYHRRSYDRYELHRGTPYNFHQTDAVGADIYLSYNSFAGKTTLGVQLHGDHIYSNKLGTDMHDTLPAPFESDGYYTKEKWRSTLVWFLKHNYVYHHNWLFSAGVVGNASNSFGHYTLWNGQAGYLFTPEVEATLSVRQSLRLPSFTDLYYKGGNRMGNPDMLPEQATTYELGLKYSKTNVRAGANVFYRYGTNVIDWVEVSDKVYQSLNHYAISTLGTELNAGYAGNHRWIKQAGASYTFLNSSQGSGEKSRSRLLDCLRHKVGLSLTHAVVAKLQASWSVIYEQRAGVTATGADYPEVVIVDAQIAWQQQHFSLYLSAENLLNKQYLDFDTPQAGRWLKTGVKVNF